MIQKEIKNLYFEYNKKMDFKKQKKFFSEWKWALIFLSFCIVGIPLTIIYGIQSSNWGNDFWPNAFSEFLGMFVDLIFGSLFTFVVIDKYILYHKNKQWKKIKNITYKNLYFMLSNILLKLNWSFPKDMQTESYILTEDIETLNEYLPKDDFDIFVDSLMEKIENLIQKKHPGKLTEKEELDYFEDEQIHASLIKFKQHTKADISLLSSTIIPKLLNFSNDSILLDYVIELEELSTALMAKINNVHRKNGLGNGNNYVKYIWLLKIQEILSLTKSIADYVQEDIKTH